MSIQKTIIDIDSNIWRIRYDIMDLFIGHAENYRVEGFDFGSDYDKGIEESCPVMVIRIKCSFFQVNELQEMNEDIQEVFEKYTDSNFICAELCVDNEGVYVEALVADFR